MFDYNDFYKKYKVAKTSEKKKLLEQLKIVLFFNLCDFLKCSEKEKIHFLTNFYPKLETALEKYQVGSLSFTEYFSQIIFYTYQELSQTKNDKI